MTQIKRPDFVDPRWLFGFCNLVKLFAISCRKENAILHQISHKANRTNGYIKNIMNIINFKLACNIQAQTYVPICIINSQMQNILTLTKIQFTKKKNFTNIGPN